MKPALVLNADFRPVSQFPLSLLSWQDAVSAVFKGNVSVVAEYPDVVRSPSMEMRLPSVVALRSYVPAPRHAAFTRFNVYLRDRFRCQYCGEKFDAKHLTFDHVIPRAKGGTSTWENVVAACYPCNQHKADRPGKPLRWPKEPTIRELAAAQREFPPNFLHETWTDYLFWDSVLEA